MSDKKTVLITGATGFLGKNIMEHLPKYLPDWDVAGVGSKPYDLRCQFDTRRMIEKYCPDVIVHAAGTVGGIGANRENPGKFMYENLIMGANLIECARQKGVKKFVAIGTVCAYPKHTQVPFREEDLWNGYPEETNAPYAIAKKTLMKLLETYHEQYGMNGVNLVPVNMYGLYDHFNLTSSHVIPALILKFYTAVTEGHKEVTVWGDGSASREFLYAPNCVEAIARSIIKDVGPEPINIGTGQEITIRELVTEIGEQMGFKGEIVCDESKPNGQPRRCLNTDRAQDRLGFKAETGFQAGLKCTIDWFLQQENKGDIT